MRKIKLLKHVFALYSLPIIFTANRLPKNFLACYTLAQLRIILNLKMQVCNVLYPGLPWIWISMDKSMDISMDIMLAHLLIKLTTLYVLSLTL